MSATIPGKHYKTALFAAVMLATSQLQPCAAPGDVDLSFDVGSTVNGTVNAMALLADGKVVIGGDFTTVHGVMRRGLARLNEDGTTDTAFLNGLDGVTNTDNGGYGWVWSIVLQPDAKILIAGFFSAVNGSPHNCIARLNPDGTVDSSFAASLEGSRPWETSMAVQTNGSIVVAGGFTTVNGSPRNGLARLNPDGSLDRSFVPISQWTIESVAVQPDGKIVLGSYNGLARLNPDGSPDSSFLGLPDPQGRIFTLALQEDGKILFSGENFPFGVFCVARANSNGTLDTSFPVIDVGWVNCILPQGDGKILLAGPFGSVGGSAQHMVARLKPDGSLDSSFVDGLGDSLWGETRCLAMRADGKILVGGDFSTRIGRSPARLNSDGSLDLAFGNGPVGCVGGSVRSMVIQADGKPILGGSFSSISGSAKRNLARLNINGSLDGSFNAEGVGDWGLWGGVTHLVLQENGKIVVGGDSLVRLNPNGSQDTSFSNIVTEPDPRIYALAVQAGGRILIAGAFESVNGVQRKGLARLNPDGALDPGFGIQLGPASLGNSGVGALVLLPDGKILIGGDFTSINGLPRHNLARLNPDGSPDTFSVDVDSAVYGCCLLLDGKILIWGSFSSINGVSRGMMARLNSDGSLDPTFVGGSDSNGTYTAKAVAPQSDGKILVVRAVWNGCAAPYFVRLTADGSVDDSFFAGQSGPDDVVDSLAVQPDGKLLLGGQFSVMNQSPCSGVVRLMGEYVPLGIQRSPRTQTAETGSAVGLGLKASGSLPWVCLWYFNGTNLIGCSTNCDLQLTNLHFSQSGAYTAVITNVTGALTSAPALLQVIAPVERRPVPGLGVRGETASRLNLDSADSLSPTPNWAALASFSLTSTSHYYFDLTMPLPPQRFYRAWQTGAPGIVPSLSLSFVPAITLTGSIGLSLRVDRINQFGPTDAWVTLDTVTLTNTPQLYFDVSAPGQPQRLYRLVPSP